MIASVRGEVLDIALDHAVIEAAGVGYKVMATPSTLATLHRGGEARLITAMIVREDSMTLYGFADSDARDLFLTLLVRLRRRAQDRAGHPGGATTHRAAAGPGRRGRHRADQGAGHRQARCRTHGARTAGEDRVRWPRRRVARAQRPRRARSGRGSPCRTGLCGQTGRGGHATRCSADDPDGDHVDARCGRRCRCWVRNEPIRRGDRGRRRGPRGLAGARRSARAISTPACGPARWASSSASRGCANSCSWSSRAPRTAAAHRITSCCPGRRGWARRRWR